MANTFRKTYRELNDAEKAAVEDLKVKAEEIEALIEGQKASGKNPRHLALAVTKLEESIMWAVKAITE